MLQPGRRLADRESAAIDRPPPRCPRGCRAAFRDCSSREGGGCCLAEVPCHQLEAATIQPLCGTCILLDVVDVIGQVDHRVAGGVVLGSEPSLRRRPARRGRQQPLRQPSLPPQVRRKRLRAASLGDRRWTARVGQDGDRLAIEPLLLGPNASQPSSYNASAMSGWFAGSEPRRMSSASLDQRTRRARGRCACDAPLRGESGCWRDRRACRHRRAAESRPPVRAWPVPRPAGRGDTTSARSTSSRRA